MVQEMKPPEKKDEDYRTKPLTDERYQTLFESINAAAFLSTYDGQIIEANQRSCELLGYSWDELLRLSLRDIFREGFDWEQFQEENAARGGLHLESESMKKDGDLFPAEVSSSLFRMKDKPMMFVLVWDITERKQAEKKLRESEKKYRGLFEYTTYGIIVLDAHGDILDVNTKVCQLFDYTKEELIGKNLLSIELLTPTSLPVVVGQFEQLLSEKTAKNYTTEIKSRDGVVLTVEISSFFLVKKNNEVDNFVLSIRNITSRIESERRRMIEHQLFQALLNIIPDSVYFKDTRHRYILVNPTKAKYNHTTPADMVGKTDFDYLPEELAKIVHDDEEQIMLTGAPQMDKIEKITRNDGNIQWISAAKMPWYDDEGNIIGVMGISRDITDIQTAKHHSSRHHELLQLLMDTIPDSIYFKDKNNKFILVNKTKASHWNVTPEDMVGKTDYDFLPQEQAEQVDKDDKHILETGESIINKIEKIKGSDGLNRWFSVTKVPMKDDKGAIIGTMGISRNITEWKRLAEVKSEKLT